MNVHVFDGKLDLTLFSNVFQNVHLLSIEEKKQLGDELLNACQMLSVCALKNLKIIVNGIGTHANIDNTHNITFTDGTTSPLLVDDCICICSYYKNDEDFIKELEIQLTDMSTGMCPQGRTHRLLQLLMAWS